MSLYDCFIKTKFCSESHWMNTYLCRAHADQSVKMFICELEAGKIVPKNSERVVCTAIPLHKRHTDSYPI